MFMENSEKPISMTLHCNRPIRTVKSGAVTAQLCTVLFEVRYRFLNIPQACSQHDWAIILEIEKSQAKQKHLMIPYLTKF